MFADTRTNAGVDNIATFNKMHVFEVPGDLRSGLYAARLQDGDEVERIPFFVLPPRGKATADTLFLIPTASYMAYANERLGYDSDLAEVKKANEILVKAAAFFAREIVK